MDGCPHDIDNAQILALKPAARVWHYLAQRGPVITASPASEKGLLGSLQSSWARGPGSAGPHPCLSQMPTLPMFVHISKSMMPTPNSPSMGFLLKAK